MKLRLPGRRDPVDTTADADSDLTQQLERGAGKGRRWLSGSDSLAATNATVLMPLCSIRYL